MDKYGNLLLWQLPGQEAHEGLQNHTIKRPQIDITIIMWIQESVLQQYMLFFFLSFCNKWEARKFWKPSIELMGQLEVKN